VENTSFDIPDAASEELSKQKPSIKETIRHLGSILIADQAAMLRSGYFSDEKRKASASVIEQDGCIHVEVYEEIGDLTVKTIVDVEDIEGYDDSDSLPAMTARQSTNDGVCDGVECTFNQDIDRDSLSLREIARIVRLTKKLQCPRQVK
jgi:hypothetical protein